MTWKRLRDRVLVDGYGQYVLRLFVNEGSCTVQEYHDILTRAAAAQETFDVCRMLVDWSEGRLGADDEFVKTILPAAKAAVEKATAPITR